MFTGQYIANRVSDKITGIADRIYVCRSGSAADTQAISDYVRYFLVRFISCFISFSARNVLRPHIDSTFRSGLRSPVLRLTRSHSRLKDMHTLELGGDQPLVKTAAALVQRMCYENKEALMAGMIVAGWDANDGGQVFTIPLGGLKVRQPFSIGGSGSTYIYAYCDATFRPKMTKEEVRLDPPCFLPNFSPNLHISPSLVP